MLQDEDWISFFPYQDSIQISNTKYTHIIPSVSGVLVFKPALNTWVPNTDINFKQNIQPQDSFWKAQDQPPHKQKVKCQTSNQQMY